MSTQQTTYTYIWYKSMAAERVTTNNRHYTCISTRESTPIWNMKTEHSWLRKFASLFPGNFGMGENNQRTNGPVNTHLISEQIISTKPGFKWLRDFEDKPFFDIWIMFSQSQGNLIYLHLLIKLTISTNFQALFCKNFHYCCLFLYKSLSCKIWPCSKIGQGHPSSSYPI